MLEGYIIMKSISILLKSVICGCIYLLFSLFLIFVVYILGLFEFTIALGILYGIICAWVTYCETIKRTIVAVAMGLLAAVTSQIILSLSGIPYQIIRYILRDNEFVRETGRLTVNEVIGYNFGTLLFWYGMLPSIVVSAIIIFGVMWYKKSIPK